MKTLFVKYNRDRLPYFQTVTKIVEDDTGVRKVIKEPLSAKATSHLKAIYSNYDLLISKYNIKLCKPTIIHNGIMFEMAQGESLEKLIVQYLDKQEKDRFITIVKKYLDYIDGFVSQRSVIFHPSTKFREIFG
jgi:hypothetical protein